MPGGQDSVRIVPRGHTPGEGRRSGEMQVPKFSVSSGFQLSISIKSVNHSPQRGNLERRQMRQQPLTFSEVGKEFSLG